MVGKAAGSVRQQDANLHRSFLSSGNSPSSLFFGAPRGLSRRGAKATFLFTIDGDGRKSRFNFGRLP